MYSRNRSHNNDSHLPLCDWSPPDCPNHIRPPSQQLPLCHCLQPWSVQGLYGYPVGEVIINSFTHYYTLWNFTIVTFQFILKWRASIRQSYNSPRQSDNSLRKSYNSPRQNDNSPRQSYNHLSHSYNLATIINHLGNTMIHNTHM